MTPRVSVLMPVRDGARWLGEAIQSIRDQTFADFEMVIVDDGSADDTPGIIEAHAKADARIRGLRQQRLGLVAALNNGLAQVRGEFIARLDADDVSAPERLARQCDYLAQHADTGLLGTWADTIDEQGAVTGSLQPPPHDVAALLMRTNLMIHSSVMMRRAALQKVGGYRAAFENAEDYDLWLRLAEVTQVAILPERLLRYRVHAGSITQSARLRQLFSARLAQRAAAARRAGAPDPAIALDSPPDWHSDEALRAPLTADLARLYRLLDGGDASDLSVLDSVDMTHDERKLAQRALLKLLRSGAPGRAALLWRFVRLHPLRAVTIALGETP